MLLHRLFDFRLQLSHCRQSTQSWPFRPQNTQFKRNSSNKQDATKYLLRACITPYNYIAGIYCLVLTADLIAPTVQQHLPRISG